MLLVDSILYEISAVTDNTALELDVLFMGTTQTDISYAIIRNIITNSNLAYRMTSLVSKWKLREDEILAWQSGTIDGGFYNDGRYPLTDPTGLSNYVYCPARIAEFAGGGAYNWAQYTPNVLVPEGNLTDEYSAYHWSEKSREYSEQSAAIADASAEIITVSDNIIDDEALFEYNIKDFEVIKELPEEIIK
jgi:hypothetical protein